MYDKQILHFYCVGYTCKATLRNITILRVVINLISNTVNMQYFYILENVEHYGGEPEQAANRFDVGFVTSK